MYTIEQAKEYGWGDRAEEFANYMNKIDKLVIGIIGLSTYDLPDYDFASAFEDNIPPSRVAKIITSPSHILG